jgi:sugar-specific transcriptional regulator TrmB
MRESLKFQLSKLFFWSSVAEERETMNNLEKEIQTLIDLGLTKAQAIVYLTLTRSGQARVKTVRELSNIARQDIYRILNELVKLGLVQKIIETPNEFEAIPIMDGVTILLQRRSKENSEIHRKAMEMLLQHKHDTLTSKSQEEDAQYVMVSGREATALKTIKAMENAQTRVDSIISWKKFAYLIANENRFRLKEAMKRGVKLRFITEKPEDEKSLQKILRLFSKEPLFKVKYLLTAPQVHVGLYDTKEVFINTSTTGGLAETPLLWSNNPSLAALVRDYFEIAWITALEPEQ